MKIEIKVPAMGESISEATIGAILKPSGSSVAMDDEIIEIETDKVNQLLYAEGAGTISWKVKEGEKVTSGQVLGAIETEGAAPAPKKEEVKAPASREPKEVEKPLRVTKEESAQQRLEAEEPPRPAPAPVPARSQQRESRKKMSRIRQVIAARLVESQQTTAMLTTFNEVDLTEVIALRTRYREQFEKEYQVKLGFMSFFVKATLFALKAVPELNGYIEGDDIVMRHDHAIGIAISTDRGLVVPVVRDCDALSFAQIEGAIADYAEKARKGGLKLEDLEGGSFTITNGGIFGSLLSTPILNPPQSGILGMHKIEKRVVVIDNQPVIRPMMYLALSYDHRLIDGKEAVTFLIKVKEAIEDPARLLLHV